MIEIFNGQDNDFSKAVCLNAAAGLIVAENLLYFHKLTLKQENIFYLVIHINIKKKFKMPKNILEKIIQKKLKKVDNLKKNYRYKIFREIS